MLAEDRGVQGCGIEIDQAHVIECVRQGVTVIQHDLDTGLPTFPRDCFDYVILSQTLPEVHQPERVIREMLRIGRVAIVSFPNFAHWQARVQLATHGNSHVTSALPTPWYQTERIRFLSLKDFETFCQTIGAKILAKIALDRHGRRIRRFNNLLAQQAVYVLTQSNPP